MNKLQIQKIETKRWRSAPTGGDRYQLCFVTSRFAGKKPLKALGINSTEIRRLSEQLAATT
ncbi:MAG TPA: hypothetical protein VE956_05335 [Nodularia sp. (in: cyanobacteria)]|nr:hypothetical protein [Nodularia sp. (in: cyanobacteria)]